jgi:hypothetical protein
MGQNGLNIYDRGNNIDETSIEITNYTEMREHYKNLIDVV